MVCYLGDCQQDLDFSFAELTHIDQASLYNISKNAIITICHINVQHYWMFPWELAFLPQYIYMNMPDIFPENLEKVNNLSYRD